MKNKPSAFDNTAFNVGGLSIDSAADRVALSGSIDITRDQIGLAAARELSTYLASVVVLLEQEMADGILFSEIEIKKPVVKTNPFA